MGTSGGSSLRRPHKLGRYASLAPACSHPTAFLRRPPIFRPRPLNSTQSTEEEGGGEGRESVCDKWIHMSSPPLLSPPPSLPWGAAFGFSAFWGGEKKPHFVCALLLAQGKRRKSFLEARETNARCRRRPPRKDDVPGISKFVGGESAFNFICASCLGKRGPFHLIVGARLFCYKLALRIFLASQP